MSQSNNDELKQEFNQQENTNEDNKKKDKGMKKNHSTRNMILFLSIFTLLCVSTTIYLISKKDNITEGNNNTDNTKIENNPINQTSKVVDDGLGLKSLSETYKRNNLMINITKSSEGPVVEGSFNSRKQTEITSIQISCLKNSEIQEQINNEIEENINLLKKKSQEIPNQKYVDISATCMANYADTLSIAITGSCYDYTTKQLGTVYLNYDLLTGNKIEFNELFTSNAAIKSILSNSAYNTIIEGGEEITDDEPIFSGDEYYGAGAGLRENDIEEDIEAEVFKFLNYYNNGGKMDFYYTTRNIYVKDPYSEYRVIRIPIKNYYNQIAIYNRFKSQEDLYEGYSDYIPNENIPVLLQSNGSGIHYDILYPGGPVDMKYMNCIIVSDHLICYVKIVGTGSRDSDPTLRDVMNNSLDEIRALMNQYDNISDGKYRFIDFTISRSDFDSKISNIKKDEYTITANEYIYSGKNGEAFFKGLIGRLQDGYWNINQDYYIKGNNVEKSTWKDYPEIFSDITYNEKSYVKSIDEGRWINVVQND